MERNAVPRMLLAFVVIALGAAVARPTERSLAQDEPFTLIDFEDAPSGRSGSPAPQLGDFYGPDVVFTGTETALVFDADTFPALPELARSGSTVVTDCYGRDVCSNEIRAGFSVPQLDVEVWVGSIDAVGVESVVVLEGVDTDGVVVASDSTVLGPSEAAIPVDQPLRIADANGRITSIRIGWATNPAGGLAIDDLAFTQFATRVELTAEPFPLTLDATNGPAEGVVSLRNTGNTGLVVFGFEFRPADSAEPSGRFEVVEHSCGGRRLLPSEECEVLVSYAAETEGEVPVTLAVLTREGTTLAEVLVVGFVGVPPPPDTDGPAPTDVIVTTGGATDGGSGSGGSDRDVLVVLLVATIALLAAVATLIRRARRRRLRAARKSIRVRGDEPATDIGAPGGPLISIRVWMRPADGTTTIEEGIEP